MTPIANNRQQKRRPRQGGFTLVELLISVSIIIILSVALYVQQSKFDSSVYMNNTAQGIALAIREAQTYGRGSLAGQGDGVYGMQFSTTESRFIFFEDIDVDGQYGSSDIEIRGYGLSTQNEISNLRVNSNTTNCLAITFKRPNPEPIYRACGGGTVSSAGTARITLSSTIDDVEKVIVVSPTGQIQVQ